MPFIRPALSLSLVVVTAYSQLPGVAADLPSWQRLLKSASGRFLPGIHSFRRQQTHAPADAPYLMERHGLYDFEEPVNMVVADEALVRPCRSSDHCGKGNGIEGLTEWCNTIRLNRENVRHERMMING
jgi:hypothetical protein